MRVDVDTLKIWRLESQNLVAQHWTRPGSVVEWLSGVQAQNYRWAKWSIGLRLYGCDDEGVQRAIQDRKIVRTWMFRGTLHFVLASDLAWLSSLLAPGVIRGNARRYRELGFDDKSFVKSQQVLQNALKAQGPLTRPQIKMLFECEGVSAEGQQLPYLLQRAALDGLICQGPLCGSEPTYVLISDWVGSQESLEPGEALGLLAARYFGSHGPATLQDFIWWSGLKAGDARQAIESASTVVSIETEGVQYWASSDPPTTGVSDIAALLPPFDEYLLGYKDRSLVLNPTHVKLVNAGGGMPKPSLMLNGEIVGIWRYKVKKRQMIVSIQPFRDFNSHELGLVDRAVDQLSRFILLPIDVRLDLDSGPRRS